MHAWLADRDVDAIGFTFRTIASLSNDVEASFDETNPAQYEMFNVRYLILPPDRKPSVPAKLIASSGRHRLYEVHDERLLPGRRPRAARSRRTARTSTQATSDFMGLATSRREAIYPGVAFAGGAAPPPTFSGATPPPGRPGTVLAQTQRRSQDGVFDGDGARRTGRPSSCSRRRTTRAGR